MNMLRLYIIPILLLFCQPAPLAAQRDSVPHAPLRPHVVPLVGSTMFATGALVTLRPELHNKEISLYNRLEVASFDKIRVDDYLQLFPLAVPFVLNLAGLESEHNFGQMALLTATSCLIGITTVETCKHIFQTQRPNNGSLTSFPSGHTCSAMLGAEILRREYGRRYPWVTWVGYGVASVVALLRMYNDRHWPSDVLAGTGVALLAVSASYALWD